MTPKATSSHILTSERVVPWGGMDARTPKATENTVAGRARVAAIPDPTIPKSMIEPSIWGSRLRSTKSAEYTKNPAPLNRPGIENALAARAQRFRALVPRISFSACATAVSHESLGYESPSNTGLSREGRGSHGDADFVGSNPLLATHCSCRSPHGQV